MERVKDLVCFFKLRLHLDNSNFENRAPNTSQLFTSLVLIFTTSTWFLLQPLCKFMMFN